MEQNNNITVYGLSEGKCKYCEKAKEFLAGKGLQYRFIEIDNDPSALEFIKETHKLETVPQIFINNKLVGGYEETVKFFTPTSEGVDSYVKTISIPAIGQAMAAAITNIQEVCHGIAKEGGWWDRKGAALDAHNLLQSGKVTDAETLKVLADVANQERNPLELLALIHSEASEALEGVRKDQMDDKLPHRKMEEVELADIIVRVLDYAGGRGLDVGGALVEKLIFNTTREDHKPENRSKVGGKKY